MPDVPEGEAAGADQRKGRAVRVILADVEPDDFVLAVRAAKWLMGQFRKDAVLAYGEGDKTKDFYVRRNKASITVRPCQRAPSSARRAP